MPFALMMHAVKSDKTSGRDINGDGSEPLSTRSRKMQKTLGQGWQSIMPQEENPNQPPAQSLVVWTTSAYSVWRHKLPMLSFAQMESTNGFYLT